MKIQEANPKENGSVRLKSKSSKIKEAQATPPSQKSSEDRNYSLINQDTSNSEPMNGNRSKKLLSKCKDDDLKFIDTSVESDLPPTLSRLQRKNVQILINQPAIDHLDVINVRNEEFTGSQENQITKATYIVSTSPEPSTSSATDIPFDQNVLK